MRYSIICLALLMLTGCARTSAIPLAADVVQVTTSAAPVCGRGGAQKVAFNQAAVETLKRGYDKFIIVGGEYSDSVRVVGQTPLMAQTQGSLYGNSYAGTTTVYGGAPVYGGSHDQGLTIKMFHDGDPYGANAISARQTLGPEWSKIVEAGGSKTCN